MVMCKLDKMWNGIVPINWRGKKRAVSSKGGAPVIALVPDRFAHYRLAVFRALSDSEKVPFVLEIFADTRDDNSGIRLAPKEYRNSAWEKGGVRWYPVRSCGARGVCIWQRGVVALGVSKRYALVCYWGDIWRVSTWVSALGAKIVGKPLVFWTHGLYGSEGRLKKTVRVCFYKLADALLVYGSHSRDLLVEAGISSERCYVINNSLDVDVQDRTYHSYIKDLSEVQSVFEKGRTIVFVGRLEANKELERIIKAVASFERRGEVVNALLVGDGSRRGSLERLARDLGIEERVRFYGACYDQRELCRLIAASDVSVAPGNVGLSAMQSLVYGTPVVTHGDPVRQMPEFEAVREGVSGALFDYGDQGALEDAIARCFEDLEEGRIDAEGCRKVIMEEYTPDYQVAVFSRMVKDVLRQ